MAPTQRPDETRKQALLKVPVLKLPPSKLDSCLDAVARSQHGLRDEVVRIILANVYPGFTVKRAFRALVAPTLTRLHFARSAPPYFQFAPNGRIWKQLDGKTKSSFVAITLFDFALVRLRVPPDYLPPNGNLRDAARALGPQMVDRVRGLDSLLRYYFPTLGPIGNDLALTTAQADMFTESTEKLSKLMSSSVPRGRMIAVDEIRYAIMNQMLSRGNLVSSFVVDEWLKLAIQEGMVFASRAAFATIESLTTRGYAINTLTLKPGV